jgi:threonine dehydrogenase-like Zn-dependent dehydrogenase
MSYQILIIENFNKLIIEERNFEKLEPGFARVQVLATAICGSDIHGANGSTGRRQLGQVMGHETSGIVDSVNDSTKQELVGRRVVINPLVSCGKCDCCLDDRAYLCRTRRIFGVSEGFDGAFAEYISVPVENLVEIDPIIPPHIATTVEPLAVGFHAVQRASLTPQDRVLIIGGGPIGQAIAFACLRLGITDFTISDPVAKKREFLEKFNFATIDPSELKSRFPTGSLIRPNVVFDAVANKFSFNDAIAYSDVSSRIILIGMDAPELQIPSYAFSVDERSLIGSYCYTMDEFISTAKWLSENIKLMTPYISDLVALSDAPELFTRLANGYVDFNRIAIVTAVLAVTR